MSRARRNFDRAVASALLFRGLAPDIPDPKTCNRCGAGDLVWMKIRGEWTLSDGLGPHVCPPVDVTTEFSNLDGDTE